MYACSTQKDFAKVVVPNDVFSLPSVIIYLCNASKAISVGIPKLAMYTVSEWNLYIWLYAVSFDAFSSRKGWARLCDDKLPKWVLSGLVAKIINVEPTNFRHDHRSSCQKDWLISL